jgi:proton-translocating NADH-quinone oxidoreductase chain N
MSSILFIALPLLFAFCVPLLEKLGRNGVAYASTLMQIFLAALAFSFFGLEHPQLEIIAIAPPLGISFVLDQASVFFVALFSSLMTLFSLYYLWQRKIKSYKNEAKFFILLNTLLASAVGLVLSNDIFNIYVFFEIAGISAYILTAYEKNAKALEAGIKYLLTGSVASIFLVLAIMLIYINIGSLNLALIAQNFETLPYNLKVLISLLLFLGFGFKVEIFPLNFWVSDVYEGSSTLINGLFSAIVVKAYLFVFFHILYLLLPSGEFSHFLIYLGALSMLVSQIVALKQTNLKRLFAYSSLGQVGLLFAAFSMHDSDAIMGAFFIVFAHSIAKMILFLSLSNIEEHYKSIDISILQKINAPYLGFIMLIAMLSILGIPLLAGFVGKFLILKSMALDGLFGAMAIILIASLLESVYYFKLSGYLTQKEERGTLLSLDLVQKILLSFLALLLVTAGTAPFLVLDFAAHAANVMLDAQSYIALILGAVQ